MITRTIGKIVRGKATPFQVLAACVLGALIGFVPGLMHAPALLLAWVALLLVINANLAIAALVGAGAKLAALLLLPVSFHLGRLLIDGPTEPLFRAMINAPVLAWAGMDHYVTVGGTVLALVLGTGVGLAFVQALQGLRHRMGALEQDSERYRAYASKWWVRLATWVLVGGKKGKTSWEDLAARRIGNPIRIPGVILAVLLVALVALIQVALGDQVLTTVLRRQLELANGATVDLESSSVDLRRGTLTITGLAMADPNELGTDLVRAGTVQADVSSTDLLTRRIAFDRIQVSDASSGARRATPGVLVGPKPRPQRPPDGPGKTIDDYLKEAQRWKDRLAQLRAWLERVEGRPGDEAPADPGTDPGDRPQERETLGERLAREAREKGYAGVRATHLVAGAPEVLIRELVIEGLVLEQVAGEVLDVRGSDLSSQPALHERAPVVRVASRSGRLEVAAALGRSVAASGVSSLLVRCDGLQGDRIGGMLAVAGAAPVRGGTVDLLLDGRLGPGGLDVPLRVTFHDATLTLPGAGATEVAELTLPIGLRGPIDNPRITLDESALQQALIDAGRREVADRVRGEAGERIDDALGDQGEEIKDAIGNILGGGRKKDGG